MNTLSIQSPRQPSALKREIQKLWDANEKDKAIIRDKMVAYVQRYIEIGASQRSKRVSPLPCYRTYSCCRGDKITRLMYNISIRIIATRMLKMNSRLEIHENLMNEVSSLEHRFFNTSEKLQKAAAVRFFDLIVEQIRDGNFNLARRAMHQIASGLTPKRGRNPK